MDLFRRGPPNVPVDVHSREPDVSDADSEPEPEPEEDEEEDEEEIVKPSMTKEHKEMMGYLQHMFADRFTIKDTAAVPAAQKLFNINENTPLLKIEPILEGSWLDPPKSGNDLIGYWPSKTKFPKGTNPYRANFLFRPPSRPTDVFITHPMLRKLLEAPKISEAYLDPTVFRSSEPVRLVGTSFPTTDAFQRAGLFDGFYTEEMLNFALQFIPMLKQELSSSFADVDLSAFQFLEKLLAMTSLSNQRSYHNQIAALVSNKNAMRLHVLTKHKVPTNTAKYLKGSDFAGEGVFGDLPESFLAKFSTAAGKDMVCTPRSWGASGSFGSGFGGLKRSLAQQGQQAKRRKPSFNSQRDFSWVSRYPKGGGFANKSSRGRGKGQRRK